MKKSSRRLFFIAVIINGVLSLSSCTDNNAELISEVEYSTTPGNNGKIDTEEEEETGEE